MTHGSRISSDLVIGSFVATSLAVLAGRLATDPATLRAVIAGAIALLVFGLAFVVPRRLLLLLVVWLAALGITRRLLSVLAPTEADPLLLVAPLGFALLVGVAASKGALGRRTQLSNAVLVLTLLFGASIFNPLQGDGVASTLIAGLGGLLFVLVPLLAFWIGREFCDEKTLASVFKLIAVLAVLASLYGLAQTFVAFPFWDTRWIENSGYTALIVGGVVRPFATFSAATEYALFAAIGLLVWLGFGLRGPRSVFVAGPALLLAIAVVYVSSRTVVVALTVALGVMVAAHRQFRFVTSLVVGAVSLLVVFLIITQFAPRSFSSGEGSPLIAHQVEGLSNPLDRKSSTLLIHLEMIHEGFRMGIENPVGLGVGTVTLAGEKFGALHHNSEADPSNVAIALGIPGLLAYVAVVVLGFVRAYALAVARRDRLALVALGILTLTLFQWLNGGQYAVAFLPWLILGWVDRTDSARAELSAPSH